MRSYFSVFTFLLPFTFHLAPAQERGLHPALVIEQPAGPKPWTSLIINDKPGQFQFVVVTDRTGGVCGRAFSKKVWKGSTASARVCDERW